jgi:glutamine amidotransferase
MITVIDYGMGNLGSVAKGLERKGARVQVSSHREDIEKAAAIVLPGVGAFAQGMKNLKRLKLIPSISRAIEEGKPFLGICLGFQLLFSESEEGDSEGLNIFKGKVKRFAFPSLSRKIPHMGWNHLRIQNNSRLLKDIPEGSYFYFVHSYYAEPEDKRIVRATTDYGIEFVSVIEKDNIFALQFHPEKSQAQGLKILENFIQLI